MRLLSSRVPAEWPQFLALGVFLIALWAQTDSLVGVFFDDGVYVALAKAMAEGSGYRYPHLPGAPPGLHYPFLYPAALSLLWRLWPAFPDNVVLFQIFDSAVLGGAAWVIASHARRCGVESVGGHLVLAIGFTASPLLTVVGGRFSEALFLLLGASAVAFADRERVTLPSAVLVGVLAGAAMLTRSIGVAVVTGVTLALWMRGQKRAAAAAAGTAMAVVIPWLVWLALHAGEVEPPIAANYGSYFTEARQAGIGAFAAGLDLRGLGPIARLTLPAAPVWVTAPLALGLFGAVALGARTLFRNAPALVWSLGFYVLAVTLWPFAPDRFMWIVVPWVFLLGARGAGAAWRWGTAGRAFVGILILALAFGFGRRQAVSLIERGFGQTSVGISDPLRWTVSAVANSTPSDAVIASEGEALFHLYTGRLTVPSYLFRWHGRDTEPLGRPTTLEYFCASGVTHVLLTGPDTEAAPLVNALAADDPSPLVLMFELADGPALYRFECPA